MVRQLYSAAAIQARVRELGVQITETYGDKDVHLLVCLAGALPFAADLMRHITTPVTLDFVRLASYVGDQQPELRLLVEPRFPMRGRHVVVVEDIIDTGATMRALLPWLDAQAPASVELCALLHKPRIGNADIRPAYVGFICADQFVVGYGLDFDERYRNLPFIGYLAETP